MPPILTTKRMLLIGVILTVVGLLSRLFLLTMLNVFWGNGALNNPALSLTYNVLGLVAFQLGLAMIVFSFVARAIENRAGTVTTPADQPRAGDVAGGHASSPARTARWMFWLGVALAVLGLVLQRWRDAWAYGLSGGADIGGSLARDILFVVGPTLQELAFPLGILLIAGSLVVRKLVPGTAKAQRVLR